MDDNIGENMEASIKEMCGRHSADIDNLKEETVRQGTSIERMDAKLNMIIGAIILSPFLWQLLTGLIKTGG